MGDLATSTQSTNGTTSSKPLAEQMPYLTQGWANANTAYNQASGAPKPTDFVSQFNPTQLSLFNNMLGYGFNTAAAGTANAGNAATGMGSNAMADAFARYSGFNPNVNQTISNANAFANDPSVGGRVDAAMMGAERAANEQYLPQIARNAAATGNRDGSKTAIQQGIVARGLAETRAGIDANMRGDLYQKGLGLSQNQDTQTLAGINAGMQGGTDAMNAGVNATGQGINQQGGIYNIGQQGSSGVTDANQARINEMLARYQFGTSSPFDALNAYYNIVGSNNWGGTQTTNSTTDSTASPFQVIGGLMGATGSLINGKR